MNCKHCNTEIINKEYGLRDFCSPECRNEHRRIYLRFKALKRRKTKDCINPSKVDNATPTESTIHDIKNSESEKIYDELGGKAWYSLAKRDCCNFEIRVKEGYCVALSEPFQGFSCKCSDCPIGQAFMLKEKEAKKKKNNSCVTRRSKN